MLIFMIFFHFQLKEKNEWDLRMHLCRQDKPAVSSKCDLIVKDFGAKKGKGVITEKFIPAGEYVLGMHSHFGHS
jgi:hypothetical protein